MFGPWVETWTWVRERLPVSFQLQLRQPHFNFITLHYLYIFGIALTVSILLFGPGDIRYIDALFFASGAATQSGLNTVDVNNLFLYQQIILMITGTICTPIFINSFVVFVRLYWFEKRFQGIVKEARYLRHTRSRSRTRSEAKEERDLDREERGVGNREIRVLREPNGRAQGKPIKDADGAVDISGPSSTVVTERTDTKGINGTMSDSKSAESEEPVQPFHRDIVFADEVEGFRPVPQLQRIPEGRPTEQHIAFVEKQRNAGKDGGTLRIPGPRDYDRGDVPRQVGDDDDDDEEMDLARQASEDVDPLSQGSQDGQDGQRRGSAGSGDQEELNADDHPMKRNITIDEPDHPERLRKRGFSIMSRLSKATSNPDHMSLRQRARTATSGSFVTSRSLERDPMPYLSWTPTIGRNSAFVDLTEEQREELGGIEYRALKTLAFILFVYYVGFHLLGIVCLLPWILRQAGYVSLLHTDGISPAWWGVFTPASMFNDLGFTLTPDSMISFQKSAFPLLLGSFLIIIGNTGFPCMLRLIIWIASKIVPEGTGLWEELRFLLDHPRRCFTLLFPSNATWWLFWVLVLLNGLDLIFFIILDLNDTTVTSLSPGIRFLDGLFQAASTRTAGFSVVNLAELHPAIQVSYLIMMYISVFPIAISLRRTNVYEEKSLGVYAPDDEVNEGSRTHSYVGTHLRRQLSFDLWYVFLGFFFIAIIEGARLENTNDYAFTLFSVLFEIVSAYGTVGLSLGYPGINASFSAEFKTLSKLIIIAMQIRGRHRGLPYALDRAILLPSESLHKKDEADASRRTRRASNATEMAADDAVHTVPGPVSPGQGLPVTRPLTARRASTATVERGRSLHIARVLGGALSAGPAIRKDKRT